MVIRTLILFLAVANPVSIVYADGWKVELDKKLNCQALESRISARQQADVIKHIVGFSTKQELKKLRFKHLSQYSRFLQEHSALSTARSVAKGLRLTGDELIFSTTQSLLEFMHKEGFLNPKRVCSCARSEAEKYLSTAPPGANGATATVAAKVNAEQISAWFAACIAKYFVPTMYDIPELEDRYSD
jgi:hypothetical protein